MSDALLPATKAVIGRRLKYARAQHPQGPMTRGALTKASGVSLRSLAEIEAGEANPSLDTLIKVTNGLGVRRIAYLLDDVVFAEVNAQMESLEETAKAHKQLSANAVVFRSAAEPERSDMDMGRILRQLQALLTTAQQVNTRDTSDDSAAP